MCFSAQGDPHLIYGAQGSPSTDPGSAALLQWIDSSGGFLTGPGTRSEPAL